jgi:hypothetical protein
MSTRSKETFLFAEPEPKPAKETQETSSAQKLLDWLQRWSKDTVCVRDIRVYGPRPIRNPKCAVDAAKTLVKYGWLTPVWAHQRDVDEWRIVRKLIVNPKVAALNSRKSSTIYRKA